MREALAGSERRGRAGGRCKKVAWMAASRLRELTALNLSGQRPKSTPSQYRPQLKRVKRVSVPPAPKSARVLLPTRRQVLVAKRAVSSIRSRTLRVCSDGFQAK